jgi:hypothetical protein
MNHRRLLPLLIAIALLPLSVAQAQFDKEYKSWYPHIAGFYSIPLGDTDEVLKDGWGLNGGVTYKPGSWPVGIILDLAYSDYNLTREALTDDTGQRIASGGDADIWSLTGGAIWAPTSGGKVGFYLSASAGFYRIKGRLTEPGTGCGWCCDPFLPWYCYPCCGGVTVVTGSSTANEFGANVAAGLTFRVSDMGSTVFLECKYNWVNTENEPGQYVPISVGYRW